TPQNRAPTAAEPTARASSSSDAKADRASASPATTAGRRTAERMVEARRLDQSEEEARARLLTVDVNLPLKAQADAFVTRLIKVSNADPTQPEGRLYRARATEVFLRIPEVQTQLQALPFTQRKKALAKIRRSFGHTLEEIARLEATDAYKDARWANGLEYMEARQQLLAEHPEGDTLESALARLRTQYFSHEAVTIAKEEDLGFFRYRRTRILGRN
ncbi:MAG: hypothetical protein AAFV29_15080, partial [Myxococcota bacterium]